MKQALKVFSIISIVFGGLAFISLAETFDGYTFIGSVYLMASGIVGLLAGKLIK